MTESKLKSWEKEFSANRDSYVRFEKLLKNLLEKLLEKEEFVPVQITSRTKTTQSLKEKIERKNLEGKSYDNPLSQITDIVGIRIITYYLNDIDEIGNLIKKEFQIDEKNSLDKSAILGIDQFGYKSVHYIISLSSSRQDLPEWVEFGMFKAEIQVRTTLQNAWAEIDHEIRYKKEENIPIEIRRRIYRLMALFELADEEFQNLKYLTEEVKAKYLEDVTWGNFKMEINVLSLGAYFSFTKQDDRWMEISNRLILDILNSYETDKDISANIKVVKDFYHYGYLANLDKLLHKLEIKTLKEFDEILKSGDKFGKDAIRDTYRHFIYNTLTEDGHYDFWFDPYSNISILIIHSKMNLIRGNPKILDDIDGIWFIKNRIKDLIK